MTVGIENGVIILSGKCGVEEVEALVGYLEGLPIPHADLSAAEEIHTALWQALIMFQAKLTRSVHSSSQIDTIISAISYRSGESGDKEPSTL